jgi:Flp pilus assembly protein TadD
MQTKSTSVGSTYRRALQALDSGRAEDAVQYLRQTVIIDPNHANAWNDLGVLMEALGNHHDARRCYETALRVRPDMFEAQSNLRLLSNCMELARWARRQVALSF